MPEVGRDQNLADAFDGQAADFERAPVQSDPAALRRLVQAAAFADGARTEPKAAFRARLAAGVNVRGFVVEPGERPSITIRCIRTIVRGVKPDSA